MAKFMKHVGKNKHGNKVVVVFREIPDDPEHCLVVHSDALMDMQHDNLMRTIESNAAQETVNLYEVLARSHFTDGGQMLNTLHQRGLLKKYSVDDIDMQPVPNSSVPLRVVNEQIATGKISSETPAEAPAEAPAVNNPVVLDTDPNAGKPEEGTEEQKKSLAESKLLQARLMEEDAKNLREEAYKLDPDLKKGGRPSKKQVKKVEQAKAEATDGE